MRRAVFLVVLVSCGCATTPPAGDFSALYDGRPTTAFVTEFPAGSASEAIARGDHAYTRGELDRALYLYMQAIEADPARPEAFLRVGLIHEQRGKLELAANAFQHVLTRDPDSAVANEKLGLVLLSRRDPVQARAYLERARALDYTRWKTVNALGVIADLEGEHTLAADYFRQALALEPQSPKILTNLGYSLYLADDWDQAEQVLLQALDQTPDYELALRNLALLHSRRGNAGQALQLLLKVTGPAQAHNDVGYLCLLEGNHALAATYFRRAIELSPSYYELAHRNLERALNLARQTPANVTPAPPRQARVQPTAPRHKAAATSTAALDSALFADETAADETEAGPAALARPAPQPARPVGDTDNSDVRLATPTQDEQPLYLKRWVSAGLLNVREDDHPDARLLDKLKRGRVVRVLREENGWAYVRYWEFRDDNIATREGWVHSDFLSDTRQRA